MGDLWWRFNEVFRSERTVHTWDSLPAVHSQISACFLFFLHALSFSADPRTTQDQYETNHDRPWSCMNQPRLNQDHPRSKQWHAPLFSFTLLSHKIIEECKLEPHHRPPMHQSKLSTSQPRPKQDPSKTKTIACSTLLFHSSFSQIIEGWKLEHHHQPSMDHHKQSTSQPRLKRCHSSIFFAHIFFDYIWVIQRGLQARSLPHTIMRKKIAFLTRLRSGSLSITTTSKQHTTTQKTTELLDDECTNNSNSVWFEMEIKKLTFLRRSHL